MKIVLVLLICFAAFAQEPPGPEIFLFDLDLASEVVHAKDGKNISLNPGYDNQPSFYSEDILVYSKTRNGQTDIAGYNLKNGEDLWFSSTQEGSEYSPKRIPGTDRIAAVRLDTTGLQRLYQYDLKTGQNSVLIPGLKVGYFEFFTDNKIVASVLTDSGMNLILYDLKKEIPETLVSNVGRSIHQVPGTRSMSYTVINEDHTLDLYLLDLEGEEASSYFISSLPEGVQDYVWLDKNRILLGKGSQLFLYDLFGPTRWTAVADLSEYGLHNISRIAVNDRGDKLALAAEPLVPAP